MAFPCRCHMSPRKMTQVQVALSSGLVQLMVPRQRLIIKSLKFNTARCMISDPAEYKSPSIEKRSKPEKIDGLEIPVAAPEGNGCRCYRVYTPRPHSFGVSEAQGSI